MNTRALFPALAFSLAFAACSGSQHGSSGGCHPELVTGVPDRPVHAIGEVNATCHNLSPGECDDELRRQACRLGAPTIIYAVTRTPVQDGETLHGTAATYAESDGGT